jgi:hypothetical protein
VAYRGYRRIVRYTTNDRPIDGRRTLLPCHLRQMKDTLVVPDLQSPVTLFGKDNKVIAHLGAATTKAGRISYG